MTERKELGKITKAAFGFGGYQEAEIGLSVQLSFGGARVTHDFRGFWAPSMETSERTQWTEADRLRAYGETVQFVGEILAKAKVQDVSQLVGRPVEVTSEGMRMVSWRILDEVL